MEAYIVQEELELYRSKLLNAVAMIFFIKKMVWNRFCNKKVWATSAVSLPLE